VRAREPTGDGGIPQPDQKGGQEHAGQGTGNCPYEGPSGTSGMITEHEKTRLDRRVAFITLMMKAASTPEMSVNFNRLHGVTTQKTAIFIAIRYCT
jgi:hypothetical protein